MYGEKTPLHVFDLEVHHCTDGDLRGCREAEATESHAQAAC